MTHFMGQTGSSGKERCAARCGVSGKHRDAPGGSVCPTEGQVLWPSGLRCASLMMPGITVLGAPCRKTAEPGEMGHYLCTLVLARSEINALDLFVGLDFLNGPRCMELALVKHRDVFGQSECDAHVVLDQQDGDLRIDGL